MSAESREGGVPHIRFNQFAGAWAAKKIGDLLNEQRRSIQLQDETTYQLLTVKRRNEGIVSRGTLKGKQILVKNYSEVKAGDYIISKRQIVHGANGVVPKTLDGAIVSNEYLVISENNAISADFWGLLSKTSRLYKLFFLSSYGVDIEKLFFDVEDWKAKEITIPGKPEQTAIGQFFAELDKLIAQRRQQEAQTRQLKQAMLGKMFPARGEKQPHIRLQGFSGDWQEVKLGDVIDREIKGKAQLEKLEHVMNFAECWIGSWVQCRHVPQALP